LCCEAFTELEVVDHGFAEGAVMAVAVAAELVGDYPYAAVLTLRFVQGCRRSGYILGLSSGIRAAARLSARAGHPDESLRLWGGAEHTEAIIGLRCMPLMQRLDGPLLQQCTDALGPDATRLIAEGAAWSVAEVSQAAEEALVGLQTGNSRSDRGGMQVPPTA
jgi:hypothetical protein